MSPDPDKNGAIVNPPSPKNIKGDSIISENQLSKLN